MAQGSSSNPAMVRGAEGALDRMKFEVARNIGVNIPESNDWGDIPSRQCGAVGGHMVRRMIEMAEENLAGGAGGTRRGF